MPEINMNEVPPVMREHKSVPHNHLAMLLVIVAFVIMFASVLFDEGNAATQRLSTEIRSAFTTK